jgi:hypothetical protein
LELTALLLLLRLLWPAKRLLSSSELAAPRGWGWWWPAPWATTPRATTPSHLLADQLCLLVDNRFYQGVNCSSDSPACCVLEVDLPHPLRLAEDHV